MKLAEALIEKKDLQVRISDLQSRYTTAAVVETGEKADEDADELLKSLEGALERMETLTVNINTTNNQVQLDENRTLMHAIARRDSLKIQINQFNGIITAIRHRNRSRSYGENLPKMVVSEGVNVASFIKKVDALAKELRILDAAIQASNWANDMIAFA